jgi:hypothetical protein
MFEFQVIVNFNNKQAHDTTFLAEDWDDAFPQAAEIVEAVGNSDHVVDVAIKRLGAAFE